MLRSTFCHVRGVGEATEARLWQAGIRTWEALTADAAPNLSRQRAAALSDEIEASRRALSGDDPHYFFYKLPTNQHWRLFPHFRAATAYLDIETTGMAPPHDTITSIALYDGETIRTYVQGRNLDDFVRDIRLYRVIVTYNGKSFDVPFIERQFGIRVNHVHLDLCHILHSLGHRGGLKGCERKFGFERGDLDGVDGHFAVLLWRDFLAHGRPETLETLIAYNVQDVLNLEALMIIAYNEKLMRTPFAETHRLPMPVSPPNPYKAHALTLARLRALVGLQSEP